MAKQTVNNTDTNPDTLTEAFEKVLANLVELVIINWGLWSEDEDEADYFITEDGVPFVTEDK